ncbi:hypothetical protein BDZ85DRAFT_256941 [Elsinoe ampelina]|uniref:Uncharacterized protein n=1 Tax=Elsinoe ampelina TaxID=302913 RepID=A0A6A6GMJ2_9PEZI|nr:hypothetical protein BDZ85DRAFT_256941 [Elsinoe ampelina]
MQYFSFIALALATTLVNAASLPLEKRQTQPVTLTFAGGPASYQRTFVANGQTISISDPLGISKVTAAPGVDVGFRCAFYGSSGQRLFTRANADGSVDIGPPQPITAVSCIPDLSQCLPAFSSCEFTLPSGGIILGRCCSDSFCAATKCRPFPTTPAAPSPTSR